jgi:regulator of protease activity HflC (stomatin/prohibitin superfamily)
MCCVCVRTQTVGVLERFGKFTQLKGPGLSCMCWPCEAVVGKVSLRIRQIDVNCETKTKDNVFVNVVISVQYQAILEEAFNAYYKLSNPEMQIQAYVYDVVRSTLPRMDLDGRSPTRTSSRATSRRTWTRRWRATATASSRRS